MPTTQSYAIAAAAVTAVGLGVGGWLTFAGGGYAECGGGVSTGTATIGGPFTLVSETGETVTEADVIDRPALVYFGYTFCPDVCPVDAAIMAQAGAELRSRGLDVRTVFISVDPERDTPEVMADFTDNLDGDMLGLTGSVEQVTAAAQAYRVYFQKAEGDDPEFYLMDHSAFTYLMAPGEGFLQVFRRGDGPEKMIEQTACFIDALPEA